jgi:hypothetical protein
MWERELSVEAALGHKILILPGDGGLIAAQDSTGYTVDPATLIYPSKLFPSVPPQPDNLGMLLTAADRFGMQVYIGSLQTQGDWSTGEEFAALHKYDPIVASEILALYGSHPSLNFGAGNWYFSHELWLNWVKYYGPGYYGIGELATYVQDMKALSPQARVAEAPVFKKVGFGIMPDMSPAEAGVYLAVLVAGSQVDIVAAQDGAGVQSGAPPISELGNYYSEMRRSLDVSIAAGTVQLWATTETFEVLDAGTESEIGWQPAPLSRIHRQIAAEAPYVSQMIEFIYGWDMSPEATYTPVEADTLLAQYTREASGTRGLTGGTVLYSVSPLPDYADTFPSKATNGTGGGFIQPLARDWVGFAGNPKGTVTATVDLGGQKTISGVHTLFAGSTLSGISFPSGVVSEYSADGGFSWVQIGGSDGQKVGIETPPMYSVGWVRAVSSTPVLASHVRITVQFQDLLFLGEIKVMQP